MDSEDSYISVYLNCKEALKVAMVRVSESDDFRERRALIEEYFSWIFFPIDRQLIIAVSIKDLQNLLYLKNSDKKKNS